MFRVGEKKVVFSDNLFLLIPYLKNFYIQKSISILVLTYF